MFLQQNYLVVHEFFNTTLYGVELKIYFFLSFCLHQQNIRTQILAGTLLEWKITQKVDADLIHFV